MNTTIGSAKIVIQQVATSDPNAPPVAGNRRRMDK
jgi:hypothetical protein